MKPAINKSENPDIAARFGDVDTYHAVRGNVKKLKGKNKSGKQGNQREMPGNVATGGSNSYKLNC